MTRDISTISIVGLCVVLCISCAPGQDQDVDERYRAALEGGNFNNALAAVVEGANPGALYQLRDLLDRAFRAFDEEEFVAILRARLDGAGSDDELIGWYRDGRVDVDVLLALGVHERAGTALVDGALEFGRYEEAAALVARGLQPSGPSGPFIVQLVSGNAESALAQGSPLFGAGGVEGFAEALRLAAIVPGPVTPTAIAREGFVAFPDMTRQARSIAELARALAIHDDELYAYLDGVADASVAAGPGDAEPDGVADASLAAAPGDAELDGARGFFEDLEPHAFDVLFHVSPWLPVAVAAGDLDLVARLLDGRVAITPRQLELIGAGLSLSVSTDRWVELREGRDSWLQRIFGTEYIAHEPWGLYFDYTGPSARGALLESAHRGDVDSPWTVHGRGGSLRLQRSVDDRDYLVFPDGSVHAGPGGEGILDFAGRFVWVEAQGPRTLAVRAVASDGIEREYLFDLVDDSRLRGLDPDVLNSLHVSFQGSGLNAGRRRDEGVTPVFGPEAYVHSSDSHLIVSMPFIETFPGPGYEEIRRIELALALDEDFTPVATMLSALIATRIIGEETGPDWGEDVVQRSEPAAFFRSEDIDGLVETVGDFAYSEGMEGGYSFVAWTEDTSISASDISLWEHARYWQGHGAVGVDADRAASEILSE